GVTGVTGVTNGMTGAGGVAEVFAGHGEGGTSAATVLVVHVDDDEHLARTALVEPLRDAGFQVFPVGDVMVGESPPVEVGKVLERGGPVVICGTRISAGSRAVRQYVRSARARSAGVRVFGVQMEPDADLEPLALDSRVAVWWENPQKAFDNLL